LARFIKRRVDKTLFVAPSHSWNYVNNTENPADVATRETAYKKSDFVNLWLNEPKFLLQDNVNIVSPQCVSLYDKT